MFPTSYRQYNFGPWLRTVFAPLASYFEFFNMIYYFRMILLIFPFILVSVIKSKDNIFIRSFKNVTDQPIIRPQTSRIDVPEEINKYLVAFSPGNIGSTNSQPLPVSTFGNMFVFHLTNKSIVIVQFLGFNFLSYPQL